MWLKITGRLAFSFIIMYGIALGINSLVRPYLKGVEPAILKLLFIMRGKDVRFPTQDIVIVKEDSTTTDQIGTNLKKFHPQILKHFESSFFKVIVFDYKFDADDPVYDPEFAAALSRMRSKVVIGEGSRNARIAATGVKTGYPGKMFYSGGRLTHVTPAKESGGRCVPSLALQVVATFENKDSDHELKCRSQEIDLGPFAVPLDEQDLMLINFVGPAGSFSAFSYVDLVNNGRAIAEDLIRSGRGSIVLIGVVAERRVEDTHRTPYGDMPGIEANANVIHTILYSRYIRRLRANENAFVLFGMVVLTTIVTSLVRRRMLFLLGVTVGLSVLLGGYAFVAFSWWRAWNPLTAYLPVLWSSTLVGYGLRSRNVLPELPGWRVPFPEIVSLVGGTLLGLLAGSDIGSSAVKAVVLPGCVVLGRIAAWFSRGQT